MASRPQSLLRSPLSAMLKRSSLTLQTSPGGSHDATNPKNVAARHPLSPPGFPLARCRCHSLLASPSPSRAEALGGVGCALAAGSGGGRGFAAGGAEGGERVSRARARAGEGRGAASCGLRGRPVWGGGPRQGWGPQSAPRAADEDLAGRPRHACRAQQPGPPGGMRCAAQLRSARPLP